MVLDTSRKLQKLTELFVDGASTAAENLQFGSRLYLFANLTNERAENALGYCPNATVILLTDSLGNAPYVEPDEHRIFTSDGSAAYTLTGTNLNWGC